MSINEEYKEILISNIDFAIKNLYSMKESLSLGDPYRAKVEDMLYKIASSLKEDLERLISLEKTNNEKT